MQLRIVGTVVTCVLWELGNRSGFDTVSNWRVGEKVFFFFAFSVTYIFFFLASVQAQVEPSVTG